MQRLLFQQLLDWKKDIKRKPLILKGVRQCGKTFLLKEFGEKSFKKTHYLNFERDKDLSPLFESSLDPQKVLQKISFYLNSSIDPKNDLLILDEIQECPNALTSLKYFCEQQSQLAVCAAGSLLGLHLNEASFPVGKVSFKTLRPMNFEEFIQATGDFVLPYYRNERDIPNHLQDQVHGRLLELLKHYFIVGGMPEAVLTYKENKEDLFTSFAEVRKRQTDLINAYYADIAKHSGKVNAMHIDRVLRSVPAQLEKEYDGSTQRYKFKGVVPGISHYERLASSIDWLESAGLVVKIHSLNTARIPLEGYMRDNFFKLFMFDVGLLGAMAQLDPRSLLEDQYGSYKGYFAENFVASELLAEDDCSLYSWKEKHYEIEFLKEHQGHLTPIEVKSGQRLKATSLKIFKEKYSPKTQIILSKELEKLSNDFSMQKIPIYRASQWKRYLKK